MKSPCVGICRMNPETGICEGCYRSQEEIANWSNFTEEEREDIMEEIRIVQESIGFDNAKRAS